jgi:cytoskeletal protein RodZ
VNRTRKDIDGFPGFLAAVATGLLATLSAAHGQQAPTAPQQTPSSTPASSAPAPTSPAPNSASSSPSSTTPTDGGSKPDPVCFKLTGHCVDTSKTPKAGAATKTSAKTNGKKLNLTAPDVSTVVPEQELKEPLQNPDQVQEVQESQTVSVKTNEGVPPDVPGGLGAIWWAVVHPSQAWRIVTPAE